MARVHGYYVDDSNDGEELCFVCAVKRTMEGGTTKIHFETSDYEYHKCVSCDSYIEDEVEI